MSLLTTDVLDAIKRNLPSATAGELQTYLTQAKQNEVDLAANKERVIKLTDEITNQKNKIAILEAKVIADTTLQAREMAVEKRENAMNLEKAQYEAVQAKQRSEDILKLAVVAFRNPRLVHTETANIPVSVPGSGGSGGWVSRETYQKNTTTEETK